MEQEIFHGSGEIVEFPESTQKIFLGDFIVQKVMNNHIVGQNVAMKKVW